MKIILTILFCSTFLLALAQPDKAPVKTINGQKHYIHTVEKGQTLYGISKLYNVPLDAIIQQNPGVENGLKIGQEIAVPTGENSSVPAPVESIQKEPVVNTAVQSSPVNKDSSVTHVVAAGETMYAIAKKYGVDFNELLAANPTKTKGLSIGDKVIVPLKNANTTNEVVPLIKNPVNPTVGQKDSVILHKVEAGHTLFFLTKQYGVTEQSIKDANDGLSDGLKKGETIRIIVPKKVVVQTTVETHTTTTTFVQKGVKEMYNVAVMLPFNTAENRNLRSKCPPIGDCPYYSYTVMSLGFRNGLMMAVDSLRKAGMNVTVTFYDTRNDSASVAQLLTKPEMKDMDIVFGPLFPQQIKLVSLFCRQQHIQNIIPVPVSNKALFNNPFISKATASVHTQITYMGKYVAKKHSNDNVIVLKNKNTNRENDNYRAFVKSYNEAIKEQTGRSQDSIRSASLGSGSGLSGAEGLLSGTKLNVIVVPSEDLGHVSSFVTKLNTTANKNPYNKYTYKVYGLEEWLNFETIDEKFKNRYNFNLCTSTFIDYTQTDIISFIRNYRSTYGTDPDNYSFNMFDAAFINLKGLYLYGVGYANQYPHLTTTGYSLNSNYVQVDATGGYENNSVFIIEYDNYRVRVVNR
jgi:LysM repeat protein